MQSAITNARNFIGRVMYSYFARTVVMFSVPSTVFTPGRFQGRFRHVDFLSCTTSQRCWSPSSMIRMA
jgi:hypothetical protein